MLEGSLKLPQSMWYAVRLIALLSLEEGED